MSNQSPNLHQTFTKSAICITLICIMSISSQQVNISKSSAVSALCTYNYTSSNIYACRLKISESVNSMDTLDITGTHLENHTDADVLEVQHSLDAPGYFEGSVFRKFENLKSLYLIGSGLMEINANAFDDCPKLERLSIINGQLSFFLSAMLNNCKNLVYFEVMSQKIQTIPEDFFGSTRNLEEFSVPVNQLTSLPEKLLHNMTKLRSVRIGYNKLIDISSNFLINAPNLEDVSLNSNEFQHQDDIMYALNGKVNLKSLWLDDNNFPNFDFKFFSQFQKLEYLSVGTMRGNKLTGIHWESLPATLTSLRINGIGENLPENAFHRVVNLTSLSMSGTAIENFHKDTFKPLASLVFLYLYNTGLKSLHQELFTNQLHLSSLLISGSQLEELPPGIFTPLVNIGHRNSYNGIEITYSKLRRLNANSFGEHPHLQYVDFSYNDINEIERGIFSKFHPTLVYARLFYNECVSKVLSGDDLDNNEELELCFKNWEEIDPNNTTTRATPTSTTPGGCARNFRSFEVAAIIFVGIFKVLLDIE